MIRILMRLVPDGSRRAARRYWALLAAVVVTRAASYVLLFPVLGRLLSGSPGDAWVWIAAFAVAVALHAVVQFRLARTGFALGLDVMEHVQHALVDHVAELPLGWVVGPRRGAAQRAMGGTGPEVAQTIGNLVTPLVLSVALPTAIALGLLVIAWPLGLAALVATPLMLAAWWGANRCARRADAAFAASVTELDDRVVEFGQAQRTLRGARRADPDRSAAGQALDSQHVATVSLLRWSVPGQLLFAVASQLALLALAVVALSMLRHGTVTVAESLALLVIAVRFLEPFTTLGELSPALQSAGTTLRGIDEVLRAPALAAPPDHEPVTFGAAPEVRLHGVRFRYPGATAPTIDGIDLVAPAGGTTAIVGPSGAGKSTLLGLIARFHDVDAGTVSIDGHDVRSLSPDELYGELGMVFQDVHLFEGSIRDNVVAGRATASDGEIAEAAALARVDEIVTRLPGGWDTPVGERGVALSGGERQRIGIARALLARSAVLLVDEATSALDPANERAIADALAAGDGRRTTIVVAHRMRTIEQADHVVFVEHGRVVEAGSRDGLLARGGRFADFHTDQRTSGVWTVGGGADPTVPR